MYISQMEKQYDMALDQGPVVSEYGEYRLHHNPSDGTYLFYREWATDDEIIRGTAAHDELEGLGVFYFRSGGRCPIYPSVRDFVTDYYSIVADDQVLGALLLYNGAVHMAYIDRSHRKKALLKWAFDALKVEHILATRVNNLVNIYLKMGFMPVAISGEVHAEKFFISKTIKSLEEARVTYSDFLEHYQFKPISAETIGPMVQSIFLQQHITQVSQP